MNLDYFENIHNFYPALKTLFKDLNIPVNYIAEEPARPRDILTNTFKGANPAFNLMEDVYFLGMVDDAAFEGKKSISTDQIKTDYDGLLLFGVSLKERGNGLLPTRSHLAEITRAFNREFHYTPVVVVFRYNQYIAFANAERQKYKQEWREGEKAGKVSLLRDVKVNKPHTGHLKILQELTITRFGRNAVNSFDGLYKYWQEVFSVSLLNKKFYDELSKWYFWAVKEVTFPSKPTVEDEHLKMIDLATLRQEHNAKNIIRLLTRFLFVWFVKEKQLIPEELFETTYIKEALLKEFHPQRLGDLFDEQAKDSTYYKAVLQNLFFATLNQTMGKREFRKDKQHMNVTNLMRYKCCFKDPGKFIRLVEDIVPFMNGGLFECLDQPDPKLKGRRGGDVIIYQDGFSDRNDNKLVVPDYIFFGAEEQVDLSEDYGNNNKACKEAPVRGLINILNSYKFTITENTPIEEDVALDPELLGRVFENLLASYNPETKTTARKQTGSFYTPREIVSYMVDESLIAYFKNKLSEDIEDTDGLDTKLRQLISFDNIQPFQENKIKEKIIKAIDACTILDPACGSGAFPMGILQKMVHLLHKLDPGNEKWKQRQIDKVNEAIEKAEEIEDSARSQSIVSDLREQIKDIEDSFENNELDYGRKLYLLENCIYGVDIQEIATQISKLRFFISLIVDQSVDKNKENFGIRPLPNLETKFVAANTLIGIDKPKEQGELFDNPEIKKLENNLKKVRHKLFSSKSPGRKRELRDEDKTLRDQIAELLIEGGWENKAARQLASWDPYDQNASSPFFDPERMFGIGDGFDIVIGNPPYLKERDNAIFFEPVNNSSFGQLWHQGKMDFWFYFLHKAIDVSKSEICFITSRYWLNSQGAKKLIKRVRKELFFVNVVDIGKLKVFDAVAGHHMVSHFTKNKQNDFSYIKLSNDLSGIEPQVSSNNAEISTLQNSVVFKENDEIVFSNDIFSKLNEVESLGALFEVSQGVVEASDKISKKQFQNSSKNGFYEGQGIFVLTQNEASKLNLNSKGRSILKPYVDPNDISKYYTNQANPKYLIYSDKRVKEEIRTNTELSNIKKHLDSLAEFITSSNKPYGIHRPRKANFFEDPKIIFKSMFLHPDFTYDEKKLYFGFSFSSIIQKNKDYSLKYLLTLLNSLFARKWFYTFGKQRGIGVDIGVEKLRLFPVKIAKVDSQKIFVQLSDVACIAKLYSDLSFNTICTVIDSVVFELYFPDHMKEKEVDILKFVEQDLKEVLGEDDFEQLPDDQKENVIEELHNRWSNPKSEIVKRMNSFAEKSPDILKPILESK